MSIQLKEYKEIVRDVEGLITQAWLEFGDTTTPSDSLPTDISSPFFSAFETCKKMHEFQFEHIESITLAAARLSDASQAFLNRCHEDIKPIQKEIETINKIVNFNNRANGVLFPMAEAVVEATRNILNFAIEKHREHPEVCDIQ